MATRASSNRHIAAATLTRLVGSLFARQIESIEALVDADLDGDPEMFSLRRIIVGISGEMEMYLWECDVYDEILRLPGEMVTEVICADGAPVLVKHATEPAAKGLWLVEATPLGKPSNMLKEFRGLPFRSVSGHVYDRQGACSCVRAVNLKSCITKSTL